MLPGGLGHGDHKGNLHLVGPCLPGPVVHPEHFRFVLLKIHGTESTEHEVVHMVQGKIPPEVYPEVHFEKENPNHPHEFRRNLHQGFHKELEKLGLQNEDVVPARVVAVRIIETEKPVHTGFHAGDPCKRRGIFFRKPGKGTLAVQPVGNGLEIPGHGLRGEGPCKRDVLLWDPLASKQAEHTLKFASLGGMHHFHERRTHRLSGFSPQAPCEDHHVPGLLIQRRQDSHAECIALPFVEV